MRCLININIKSNPYGPFFPLFTWKLGAVSVLLLNFSYCLNPRKSQTYNFQAKVMKMEIFFFLTCFFNALIRFVQLCMKMKVVGKATKKQKQKTNADSIQLVPGSWCRVSSKCRCLREERSLSCVTTSWTVRTLTGSIRDREAARQETSDASHAFCRSLQPPGNMLHVLFSIPTVAGWAMAAIHQTFMLYMHINV